MKNESHPPSSKTFALLGIFFITLSIVATLSLVREQQDVRKLATHGGGGEYPCNRPTQWQVGDITGLCAPDPGTGCQQTAYALYEYATDEDGDGIADPNNPFDQPWCSDSCADPPVCPGTQACDIDPAKGEFACDIGGTASVCYSVQYDCVNGHPCYNDFYKNKSTGCQPQPSTPNSHCDSTQSCTVSECYVNVSPGQGLAGETKFTVSATCRASLSEPELRLILYKLTGLPQPIFVNSFVLPLEPDSTNPNIKTLGPGEFGPIFQPGDYILETTNSTGLADYGKSPMFSVADNPNSTFGCNPPDLDLSTGTCKDPRCKVENGPSGPTCVLNVTPVPTIPPFSATRCPAGDAECIACVGGDDKNPQGIWTGAGCIKVAPGAFIGSILGIVLGIAGGIALILIIYSGYRMVTAAGNPETLQGARETLTAAIVGLLFVIFSIVILEVIGVDILKLPGFDSNSSSTSPPAASIPPECSTSLLYRVEHADICGEDVARAVCATHYEKFKAGDVFTQADEDLYDMCVSKGYIVTP